MQLVVFLLAAAAAAVRGESSEVVTKIWAADVFESPSEQARILRKFSYGTSVVVVCEVLTPGYYGGMDWPKKWAKLREGGFISTGAFFYMIDLKRCNSSDLTSSSSITTLTTTILPATTITTTNSTTAMAVRAVMTINNDGIRLIKSFENFSSVFYNDSVGISTIGYGHACPDMARCSEISTSLSKADAEKLLLKDLKQFERCVRKYISNAETLNGDQFSALVSFAFNLGCGNLARSTLRAKLNKGDTAGAADEFVRWNKAGGKVLRGLTRRREAERTLFCKSGGC